MKTSKINRFLAAGMIGLAIPAQGANFIKANNSANLNLASSWINNGVPGAADIAIWNNQVSSVNTVNALGASTTWDGIQILNPGAPVALSTDGYTLTNGAAGIDLSAATQNLTVDDSLALNVPQYWRVGSGLTLTLNASLLKGVGGAVRFELADSTANVVVTNPANALLLNGDVPFGTVNDTDFAAINGSGQIVGGNSLGLYTANPTGNFNGTVAVVDFSTPTVAGLQLSKNSVLDGLRINEPNTLNPYWTISTGTKTLSINSILVTTNVGAQPVYVNGGGPVRIYETGTDELLLYQNNPAGALIFQSTAAITQQGGAAVVTKLGAGTVQIQSVSAYTGGTRIYEGTLGISGGGTIGAGALSVFGGSFASTTGATNFAPTTVFSGAADNVAISSTGGQFVQATNLNLAAGAHLQFTLGSGVALSSVNAPLVVTNAGAPIAATNAVSVDILGNLTVGQFPLVKYATLGGNGFTAFALGSLQPHISAYLSNNVARSTIDLVVLANNDPLTWATGSGVWDIATTANWDDATGASTTYQQSGIFADSVVFNDATSGASPITVTLNTNVTPSSAVFAATKTYTVTGTGGINGATSLTKAGAGTLTLAATNGFSGGLNLNGGVVNFTTLANLGSGAINFSGGTLAYTGNTDDISSRTITFNSGGATINDGGGAITFANAVGNGGTGGLTKIGSGTLTLNGTNVYLGDTVVGAGMLALGSTAYISNSVSITVSNGATLDVSAASPIVLQNQILYGAGTVNGGVWVGSGASISPATSGSTGTLTINNGDLTVSGGTLAADVSTAGNDAIVVNGNLNLTGGTLQVNVLNTLTNGTYKLIQYSGSLLSGAGSSANLALTGFSQSGKVASLTDANANEIDLVVSSAGGASLVWQGDGGNNFWDVGTTADWMNSSGASVTFGNADNVTFDNSSPNQTVNLKSAVQPDAITVNGSVNYTFQDGSGTGAGKISGATGINKNGSGTLTLLTADNNSGATVITGGSIQVGNDGTTADIGTGNITNNGALIFEQTDNRNVAGQVSGTGSLTQQGAATLTLEANNSYSGPTIINSGTLQVGTGGNAGSLGSSAVTNNGVLVINRTGTYLLNNGIAGAGSVSLVGSGTTILSGNNTYQGSTYISNGIVQLGAADVIPSVTTVPGSTGGLTINGSTTTLDLNGFNEIINELTGASGLITNSASSGTNSFTIGDGNSTTFSGLIAENAGGAKIALVKQGSGTLELDSANPYSGGTIVGAGTLSLRAIGAAGSAGSSITLSNGATLSLLSSGSSHASVANTIVIADTAAGTINADNVADAIAGSVTGSGSGTNLIIGSVSFGGANLQQYQNFAGTVEIQSGAGIRFSATAGLNNGGSNTVFDLEGGSLYVRNNGTVSLGALIGNASGSIAAPSVTGVGTFLIGGKGINTTFPGIITGANNLVKVGSGTLTLDGSTSAAVTLNGDGSTSTNYTLGNLLTYTGTTTVSNGVLALVSPASLTTSPSITLAAPSAVLDVSQDGSVDIDNQTLITNSLLEVVSGQTLGGIGTIRGSILADVGSTVNIGLPTGVLTVTTNVELAGTVNVTVDTTNAPNSSKLVAQSFVIDPTATLIITNAGNVITGGAVFQIFSRPVTGFSSITLPSLSAPFSWTNRLAIDGTIAVLGSTVNTNAVNLGQVVTGTNLTLSWPTDHTGWHLQAQTNSVSVGLGTNWVDVAGSTSTNQITIRVNQLNGSVFFRLTYP